MYLPVMTLNGAIQPGPGKRPVGILANVDGNYSANYAGAKNVRVADHIHYGDADEPCAGCDPVSAGPGQQ